MRTTYTKKSDYLKYIAVALGIVVLIVAAFLLLYRWEDSRDDYSDMDTEDGIIEYKGKEYKYKDNIETFLVLGLDKFEGNSTADSHESGVQADFLMLFVFDNETRQSAAIHINRDTMVNVNKLDVGGSQVVETFTKQIALAYNYANVDNEKIRCRNTKDSVEALLNGAKVDHYLALTMDAVPASCDLVDGVEITVLNDFTGIDNTLIKDAKVTLRGEQALRYVRSRHGLEDETNSARMERQQQYINAWYEKTVSRIKSDDEFILELVSTMDDYVVYDSSDHKMQKFVEKFEDYEFLGIREFEGELKQGKEFVEFYADEESVWDIVIDLFYDPIEK